MHHTCAQLHAWIYNTRDQRSLASIVSQGPSSLQDPRTETAHSVLNQNIAYQDQQLKSDLRANCLGQQFCPGSTRFVAVKEWPSKWLKIVAFCPWNLYDNGHSLSETPRLTSYLRLRMSSNCTCASLVCKAVVGPKSDQPNRSLRLCYIWKLYISTGIGVKDNSSAVQLWWLVAIQML